jgi:hypothetical protein
LLAVLYKTDDDLNTFELAAAAFELQPDSTGRVGISPAQIGTVRRALGKLAREGLVVPVGSSKTQPGRGRRDRGAHWISARALPAYRQREEPSLDRLAAAIAASRLASPRHAALSRARTPLAFRVSSACRSASAV